MRGNAAGGAGRGEISPSEDSGVEPRKLFLCVQRVSVVQAFRTEGRSDGMGVHGELRLPKRDAQWGWEPLRSAALQSGGWLRLVHADWEIGAPGREASRECCEVVSGVNLTRTGSDSKSRPPSPRPSPPGRGRSICRVLTQSVAGCAWSTGPLIRVTRDAGGDGTRLPEAVGRVSLSSGVRAGVTLTCGLPTIPATENRAKSQGAAGRANGPYFLLLP